MRNAPDDDDDDNGSGRRKVKVEKKLNGLTHWQAFHPRTFSTSRQRSFLGALASAGLGLFVDTVCTSASTLYTRLWFTTSTPPYVPHVLYTPVARQLQLKEQATDCQYYSSVCLSVCLSVRVTDQNTENRTRKLN